MTRCVLNHRLCAHQVLVEVVLDVVRHACVEVDHLALDGRARADDRRALGAAQVALLVARLHRVHQVTHVRQAPVTTHVRVVDVALLAHSAGVLEGVVGARLGVLAGETHRLGAVEHRVDGLDAVALVGQLGLVVEQALVVLRLQVLHQLLLAAEVDAAEAARVVARRVNAPDVLAQVGALEERRRAVLARLSHAVIASLVMSQRLDVGELLAAVQALALVSGGAVTL